MKFSDIVDLAKAGYKPADIKELLTLEPVEPKAAEEPAAPTAPKTEEPATDSRDAEIAALKKQLADLQAQAVNHASIDTPKPVDPLQALSEVFK